MTVLIGVIDALKAEVIASALFLLFMQAEYLHSSAGISLISPSKKSRKNLTNQNDYIRYRPSLALLAGNDGRATVGCVLSGEDE